MNRQEDEIVPCFKVRKCEDQRKLQEEIGDCNTLCKLWLRANHQLNLCPGLQPAMPEIVMLF